eukprot:6204075-Pleurochrysis_carterae.AAC.1
MQQHWRRRERRGRRVEHDSAASRVRRRLAPLRPFTAKALAPMLTFKRYDTIGYFSAICALRGVVRTGGEGTQNSIKAKCSATKTPPTVEARAVAVRCAHHTHHPWRGTCVHSRVGGGRAAAVHFNRVGECGLLRPCDVIGESRIRRIISFARTARGGRGGEIFNMRMGNFTQVRIDGHVRPRRRERRLWRNAF